MIAPEGGTTINIEIDIMEIGVTATPFGESQETMNNKIIMSIFKLHNKNSLIISNGNLICIKFLLFSADFRRNAAPSVIFQGTERPGCCEEPVPYLVRDDNVAEPDEILTISIAWSITSASIHVEFVLVQRVNVTIIDNDSELIDELCE